jgi:hypothetical protein
MREWLICGKHKYGTGFLIFVLKISTGLLPVTAVKR